MTTSPFAITPGDRICFANLDNKSRNIQFVSFTDNCEWNAIVVEVKTPMSADHPAALPFLKRFGLRIYKKNCVRGK